MMGDELPDHPGFLGDRRPHDVGVVRGADNHHADAHVQRAVQLAVVEGAGQLGDEPEQRRARPRVEVDDRIDLAREHSREVLRQAATRDVGERLDGAGGDGRFEDRQIVAVRFEERLAEWTVEPRRGASNPGEVPR